MTQIEAEPTLDGVALTIRDADHVLRLDLPLFEALNLGERLVAAAAEHVEIVADLVSDELV